MIDVSTGSYAVAKAGEVIRTSGIGSCIVVVVYDEKAKTGGLAHIMVPQKIEPIISQILVDLKSSNLIAKLYGGANMFPDLWSGDNSIGNLNIKTAKEVLSKFKIPLVQQDIGGQKGRSLEFELENGNVDVLCQKY